MTENKNSSVIGKRVLAALIDYFIVYVLFILGSFIYLLISGAFAFKIKLFELMLLIFLWFFIIVLPEYNFGVTLGKKIVGIRTISLKDKKQLTFIQTLKRRILDPIDVFMLGIISIIVMSKSAQHQRFGDKFAKTTVVNKKIIAKKINNSDRQN
ncbi:RDD family protein [Aquimarina brevivitae]|uniref:Putative RDD family membrane protein YckC n=1 Tax=Aquimarina brevivitae TaxID=323412 RepID=A0A4Q7P237_9FLAO|nr:RDD family protein [Aquimarina brevivitae]RZS93398.1 putative RDD family membrane protein YckC [Aquimarina brevivitae]